jgi:hypothetical protein
MSIVFATRVGCSIHARGAKNLDNKHLTSSIKKSIYQANPTGLANIMDNRILYLLKNSTSFKSS